MNDVLESEVSQEVADRRTIGQAALGILARRFPDRSVDSALTYPDDAKAICVEVRKTLLRRQLTDHEILQCLINERKRGNAAIHKRRS